MTVIIHPYYIGRDKGPLFEYKDPPPTDGSINIIVPEFDTVEDAKQYLRDRGREEWQVEHNYHFPVVE